MPTTARKLERWGMRGVAAALLAVTAMRGCGAAVERIVERDEVVVQRTDSLQHYKDMAGREHAARKQTIASVSFIRSYYAGMVDSLTASLGIKEKQLESFATAGTEARGTVPLTVVKVPQPDGDTARRFTYSDRWLDLAGTLYNSTRTPELTYAVRDSLAFTTYWKRPWLLGRKSYYIDVYSLNPNARVTGLQGAQVARDKAGRFGLGAHVGYGIYYDGALLRHGWQAGVSLNYDLIQF